MSTSILTASRTLMSLALYAEFDYLGERYALLNGGGNVNANIKKLSNGKSYRLNRRALVQNVEEFDWDVQQEKRALYEPKPEARMGDLVRVKTGRFGGKVGIIAKVNEKTYHMAVWKSATVVVGFDAVERIDMVTFMAALATD